MRNLSVRLASAAVLLLAACDSDSSPTAPRPASVPSTWTGTVEIVGLTEGDGTCLADYLRTLTAGSVRLDLPAPNQATQPGSVVSTGGISFTCRTFVRQSPTSVSWSDYKCFEPCIFAAYACGSRQRWSYCEGHEDFTGTVQGDLLVGEQTVSYWAFDGKSSYPVRGRYRYTLRRQ